MATRRMFSNRIANSARFLQMPAEAQLLYFHMILRADDDGVVESYPLIKLLNFPPDNFKILLVKNFIRQLNEDQVIVILDWLEHNTIRADRKVDSIYKQLLLEKAPDLKIVNPKPRSDVEDNSQRLGGQSTDGLGKVRLGKVRLSKVNEEYTPAQKIKDFFKNPEILKAKLTAEYDIDFLNTEVAKFISYWTEPTKSGRQVRWETERTFEIERRLNTWFNNAQKFNKDIKIKKEPFRVIGSLTFYSQAEMTQAEKEGKIRWDNFTKKWIQ